MWKFEQHPSLAWPLQNTNWQHEHICCYSLSSTLFCCDRLSYTRSYCGMSYIQQSFLKLHSTQRSLLPEKRRHLKQNLEIKGSRIQQDFYENKSKTANILKFNYYLVETRKVPTWFIKESLNEILVSQYFIVLIDQS